jgi:hypothetical protein
MAPYSPRIPEKFEKLFEEEGYGRNDAIVPSSVGVPAPTGLGDEFVEKTQKFFDETPLDPEDADDAELIRDLTNG